jgi:hypothetical protein
MQTTYFLPINSINLANYFGSACITPAKYIAGRADDVQSKFSSFLLLCSKNFDLNECDCSLELVLSEEENKNIINIEQGFFLFSIPLPITRVKSVLFQNDCQKEKTVADIEISTAFIPKELLNNFIHFEKAEEKIMDNIKPNSEVKEWNDAIKKFDSLLGGFSLMRLAGEEYMNYSKNYFPTLSFYCNAIKDELLNNKKEMFDTFDASIGIERFKTELLPILSKRIESSDLETIAKKENQKIEKSNIGLIDFSKLKELSYIVAVLYSYYIDGKETGNKKIDSLISKKFNDVQNGEGIAFCYGYNRGYSAFNNKYKDKMVKFQLNSKLDYYTIESLYQATFYEKTKKDFSYLAGWCPRLTIPSKILENEYVIMDVVVVGKKEKIKKETFWDRLNTFSGKSLPLLLEEFCETIYNEAKTEISEEYKTKISAQQEEIEKLKSKKQKESECKPYQIKEKDLTVAKSQIAYKKNDVKQIIDKYLEYKAKDKKSLEEEAKQKQLKVTGKNKDEIIMLLMTNPETNSNLL